MADEDDILFEAPRSLKGLNPASPNARSRRKGSKPARVNLRPEEFEHLIEDQGVYVRITPTVICPNRTELGDTNHVLDCPLCHGDQVVEATDLAIEDWGYIQGIKLDKQFNVQGIFDMKDATISMKQKVKLHYWYKIEVLDFSAVFNQVLKRSITSDRDRLRYVPSKPGATELKLGDLANKNKAPDIPYICIDSLGNSYQIDKHYKIDGQYLQWKSDRRPLSGTLYSLQYPILPTFRVLELMHEHRYYYVDFKRESKIPVHLPQQAVIRWDYLARGKGNEVPNE